MKVTVKTGFALFVLSKRIGFTHLGIGYELTKAGIPLKAPNGQLAKFGERAIDSIDNPCYNELTCQVKGEDYTCYRMSNKLRDEILKGIEEAKIEEMDFTAYKDYGELEDEICWKMDKVAPWYTKFRHHSGFWCDIAPWRSPVRKSFFSRYRHNVITEEYVKEMKYKYSDVEYEGKEENDPFDWWVINASNYFYDIWFKDKYHTPWEVRQRAWIFIGYLGDEAEYEHFNPTKKPKRKKKDTETSTEEKPKKKTTRRKKEKEE